MADLNGPPEFVLKLKDALAKNLRSVGIQRSKIEFESVPSTKLYRFVVLAKGFEDMGHTERQDLVWRIADRVLSKDEQLCISMILTMTSDEYAPKRQRRA